MPQSRPRRPERTPHSGFGHVQRRFSPLQARTLAAIGTDTHTWDNPTIT